MQNQMQNQSLIAQQGGNTQQLRLVPVSSNVSYLGTTVNYGLGGSSGINASSSQNTSSGNYVQSQQSPWNTSYSNTGFSNFNPSVSASQFGQMGSGVFDYNMNNQYRRNFIVQPSVDISETSSDICVSAFVTNNPVNNINLNVTQDSCIISCSVWTGSEQLILHRTIPLSTSVRAEAVEATLQSGVLEIRLPKTEKMNRNKSTVGQDVIQG